MKNKTLITALAAVILITLAGYSQKQTAQCEESNTAGFSSASVILNIETSDDAVAENSSSAVDSKFATEKETTVPAPESTSKVSTQNTAQPSVSAKQDTQNKESASPKSTETSSKSTQTVTEKPVSATVSSDETTSNPSSAKPAEPQFDINYWITYAENYAESVGLRLERSAVDCWDNPISANAKCKYLERDIKSRLNYYAKAEDITDVWIWAEKVADNSYEIYIGYA